MTKTLASVRGRALVVLAATLAGMALTASLGRWQLDRAAQKERLQHALEQRTTMPELPASHVAHSADDAATQHYRRVRWHGRWLKNATLFLDNRQMGGRPGFYVVTPFKPADSDQTVLVQRGWAPRDQLDRTRTPAVPTPEGDVTVIGHIAPPPGRLVEFSAAASGPIRQNLDLVATAREIGARLAPVSVVQDASPDPDDGLLRQWPPPAVDVHKHYGYAFQWFALCALMAGLYVWFQLLRPRLERRA